MRQDANKLNYDAVTIFGKPALFTDWRIDRDTVPSGLYCYELRHADEDWGTPCQVSKTVPVQFFGTILTSEPIPLGEDGCRDFDSAELVYTEYNTASIPKYLSRYGLGQAS